MSIIRVYCGFVLKIALTRRFPERNHHKAAIMCLYFEPTNSRLYPFMISCFDHEKKETNFSEYIDSEYDNVNLSIDERFPPS